MYQFISDNFEEITNWVIKTLRGIDLKAKYIVSIKKYHKKRSTQLNSLYWAWIEYISRFIGEDKNSLHESYKRMFLPWYEISLPGGLSYYESSKSSKLDVADFMEYMDKIHNHAYHFFGISLPYPDDENFDIFMTKYNRIVQGEII